MARRPTPDGSRRLPRLALAVAAAAAAAYAVTLSFDFVYDDRTQLVENPWLPDLGNLGKVFTTNAWAFDGRPLAYYRPVMHLAYMLTYQVAGLTPWAFHAVNVLLHAANAALVLLLAATVLRRAGLEPAPTELPAVAAGLLFALHPALTESVAWVACVPELTYSACFLAALLLHAHAERLGSWARWASVLVFFSGLLCKEPAILLPGALVAFDLAFPPADRRAAALVRRYLPYALAAAGYLVLRHAVLSSSQLVQSHGDLTVAQALVNAMALFARYLATLALPVDLNAYHLVPEVRSLASAAGLASLAVTALFCVACLLALRRSRPALLGLCLVALPLLPVLYAPLLAGENTFAERYLYLSASGLALLAALGLAALLRRRPAWRPALLGAVALVLVACAAGTVRRSLVWRSDEALWTDTVARTPHSAVVRHELGVALVRLGRLDAAEVELREAIRLLPSMSIAHYNLALALQGTSRDGEALLEYRRAVEGDRPTAEGWNNLGQALARRGQLAEAIACYLEALRLRPDALNARLNLGRAYDEVGRPDEALTQYLAALQAWPGSPDAHLALGVAYGVRGDLVRAVESLQTAARLGPGDPVAFRNLAHALRLSGRIAEADAALARASALEARAR